MPAYPQINKTAYSFCSIEADLGGFSFTGIQAINYKVTLKPGIVRGVSARKNGRTLGTYEPTASMTMYKLDADEFLLQMGDGYGVRNFDITLNFAEPGQRIATTEIIGCRITEVGTDNKEGEEATMVTFELDVMDIITDGISIIPRGRV